MKNIIKFSVLAFGIIIMTGCGTKEDYTLKCILEQNNLINNYKISSTYEIITDGKIVKKVKTTETVISENQDFLDAMESTLRESYNNMNEAYGGYTVDIKNEDGEISSLIEIDYTTMNIGAMLEAEPSMQNYANDKNQMTLEGVKQIYIAQGATCEE